MAAEVHEWVEGKVTGAESPLVVPSSTTSSSTGNGSVSTGEPALSVISDTLSEEYSSDSGKGGSDTTVTPPDSISGTETVVTPWHLCHPYSTYTAYSKSLGSIMPNHAMIYEFEIQQAVVGRLIGRYGSYVNKIKITTGANIIVKQHQQSMRLKICAVEGVSSEIDQALLMIRERFPLKRFPQLTLEQVNMQNSQVAPASNISFIPNNRLSLIEGVVNDVAISSVADLDHIFVQQPTHPTFPALSRLHQSLNGLYEQPKGAPQLVRPFNPGVICITKIGADDWVRAEVVAMHEEKDQVTARLVDVGGYVQVPIEGLRQIRVDFVTIPFQSTECRLANIAPANEEEGWSEEAVNFFKIICQGQVLQAHVVGYNNQDGSTFINLYKPNGNSTHILINEELVTHNYAKWIDEIDQQYYYTDNVTAYSNEIDQLSQNLGEWVAISPNPLTVAPTEETVVKVEEVVPETQVLTTSAIENTTLSWADEMSSHDLEECSTEDLTVQAEDENARRKSN
ncbi:unnamed protein product [Orchesella dallaii]|uniref:Tudor domain-containing protein n=1 Tax=Orchesella dallaii TaxID=48710 RepID=A0ABP1RWK6_9HEXA